MKFLCEQCKAKYQIADEKAVGKTVRMKCRKCGHLIEVRAAVTESSVSSALPRDRVSALPEPARPPVPQRPPPRRAKPLTPDAPVASAVAKRSAERAPGALEGAFKSAVEHDNLSAGLQRQTQRVEDESSTPFDMADLSPSDEWYVAINGVPVGPIRVAEVRRKAALGAVNEESLVWQEGLDEWRPLRFFPELAISVREAMSRVSRPPAPEPRSTLPPPPSIVPGRSAQHAVRPLPPRALPAPASPVPRSNVVPFTSRLATAERLEPAFARAPQDRTSPVPQPPLASSDPAAVPSANPDPFANAASALAAPLVPTGLTAPSAPVSALPPGLKKSPPWIPLAMIAAAVAFGATAAYMLFLRPEPPAASVAWPQAGPSAAVAPSVAATGVPVPSATAEGREQVAVAATPVGRTAAPRPVAAAPSAAPSNTGRSLDLHSLTQNSPSVSPTDDPGSEATRPSGQSLSEGQVQQVLALHRTALSRVCWERNPSSRSAVNVSVLLTVAPDGSAQNVSSSGDEPSVAKCIENDVRGWRFPATGSSQKISIPFKFVRQ